jgi:hypothetical protein
MAQAWRDGDPIAARLYAWLTARLAPAAFTWLQIQGEDVTAGGRRALYTAFARAPQLIPRQDLHLGKAEAATARALVPGFDPCDWSLDQTARAWLLLVAPAGNPTDYAALLDPLFRAADVRELIALCQSLPLLPHPAVHLASAQAAVRSNMNSVFAAVALRNPYPAAHFAEPAWNQMILKALFIGAPLAQIIGLDARANPRLTRMLVAYARERRAAHRPVPGALWQASAPYLEECDLDALRLALESENSNERNSAALAMAASPALQRRIPLPALAATRTH